MAGETEKPGVSPLSFLTLLLSHISPKAKMVEGLLVGVKLLWDSGYQCHSGNSLVQCSQQMFVLASAEGKC